MPVVVPVLTVSYELEVPGVVSGLVEVPPLSVADVVTSVVLAVVLAVVLTVVLPVSCVDDAVLVTVPVAVMVMRVVMSVELVPYVDVSEVAGDVPEVSVVPGTVSLVSVEELADVTLDEL